MKPFNMNPDHVPIEDQIANLRDCGIEPVSRFAIEYVVREFGREELESRRVRCADRCTIMTIRSL